MRDTGVHMTSHQGPPRDVASVLKNLVRPSRVVVTAGMPYANGPLHLGHLAGAQLPADIYARFMGMVIGRNNVLYVNGTDDHGSTSEVTRHRSKDGSPATSSRSCERWRARTRLDLSAR